ncbi:hypothetical protein Agub_g5810, partial [Astrephomene gubernaculifera]
MNVSQPDKWVPDDDIQLPSALEVVEVLRLLIAADVFPRGGLYSGYYGLTAALRYEYIWLKVLKDHGSSTPPPLDVALAWFIHRQFPVNYQQVTARRCGRVLHPADGTQAFAFSSQPSEPWRKVAGPPPAWPPPAPGSEHDPTPILGRRRPMVAVQLAEAMSRCSWLLHSWLRPHYLDAAFLQRATKRYLRFLRLHAAHPDSLLVPAADMALIWHTHLGLSGRYEHTCRQLFGRGRQEAGKEKETATSPTPDAGGGGTEAEAAEGYCWRPAYLDLDRQLLEEAYGSTARLYQEVYGEPFADAYTGWIPESDPHPLTTPDISPLAFTLRAFDEEPGAAASAATAAALAAVDRQLT